MRKFIANRRANQLSVDLCCNFTHISTLRLEFLLLSNKIASAAPHVPSAVSAHRRWVALSPQGRSPAALRLVGQTSARPREDGHRAMRTDGVAVAASTARALVAFTLGSQGGTSGCSGHHWRCCSARKSEIFIYVSQCISNVLTERSRPLQL